MARLKTIFLEFSTSSIDVIFGNMLMSICHCHSYIPFLGTNRKILCRELGLRLLAVTTHSHGSPFRIPNSNAADCSRVVETSRENTNGDTAVEIIANEPFTNDRGTGQYTHKIYHLGSKVPSLVGALLPASSLMLVEKAWNAYPHCRTEYANPFLKDRFHIVLESRHIEDAGDTENAFNLTDQELAQRKIIWVNIADDKVADNRPEREPANFLSKKTGRGNLSGKWWVGHNPVMCCYKLVTIKFQVFGLQTRVEDIIMRNQKEILTKFHKEVFCHIDGWHGLSMADIRVLEDQVKRELDQKLNKLGMTATEEEKADGSVKSTPF